MSYVPLFLSCLTEDFVHGGGNGDAAPPARGSKAKGKAKAAPRAPRGAAAGTGPPRGAKRAAEGAAAAAARATRAKR